MQMQKKMDMEQFAEEIRERLEQQGRFKADLKYVLKNNGVKRLGLMMRRDGNNLVPTIYIEPLFELYENGADMEEIVRKILEVQGNAPCEGVDMSFMQEFSGVKDRLCMKLVNRENNSELLSKVPYRGVLDLAVVYYVDCYNPEIGAGTIQVYRSHMEMWGVTEEELWEAASINTPVRRPGRIESLEDILAEMLEGQEDVGGKCRSCMCKSLVPMLVISNTERLYGAAVVLYSGMLKQAADKTGSDLFILPSSLHELIAIPMNGEKAVDELREMVIDVNRKQLQPEEMLSDSVYIYRREQDRLEVAC